MTMPYMPLNEGYMALPLEQSGGNWWRRPLEPQHGEKVTVPARPTAMLVGYREVNVDGTETVHREARAELLAATGMTPADLRLMTAGRMPDAGPHHGGFRRHTQSFRVGAVFETLDPSSLLQVRGQFAYLRMGDIRAVFDKKCVRLFTGSRKLTPNQAQFLNLLKAFLAEDKRLASKSAFAKTVVECGLLTCSQRLDAIVSEARRNLGNVLDAPMVLREVELERVRLHRSKLMECMWQASNASTGLMTLVDVIGPNLTDEIIPEGEKFQEMLDDYLHAYSQCAMECRMLLRGIEDFEASMTLALQARRLHIEEFELNLVMGTVAIGIAAMIPSFFGMNLMNTLEGQAGTFRWVALGTCLISVTIFFVLRFVAMSRGVFPSDVRSDEQHRAKGSWLSPCLVGSRHSLPEAYDECDPELGDAIATGAE